MRKLALAALLGLATGCAALGDDIFRDMANNQFMDVRAERIPDGMAGRWTGVSGPAMMTLDLREDGSGQICTALGASNSVHAVKFSNGTIYDQGGTRINVTLQADRLAASYPYKHGPTFDFHRDNDLAMAAPYCRATL